jgi:hypothetical protein
MIQLPALATLPSFYQLFKQYGFIRRNFLQKSAWFATLATLYAGLTYFGGLPLWLLSIPLGLALYTSYREYKKITLEMKSEAPWTELAENSPRAQEIYQMVRALSHAANMPTPKIVTVDNKDLFLSSSKRFIGKHYWQRNYLFLNQKLINPPVRQQENEHNWSIESQKLLAPLANEIAYLKINSHSMSVLISLLSKSLSYSLLISAFWFFTPLGVLSSLACYFLVPHLNYLFSASVMRSNAYLADAYAALLVQKVLPICQILLPTDKKELPLETLKRLITERPSELGTELDNPLRWFRVPEYYYWLPGRTYALFFKSPSHFDRLKHLCEDVDVELEVARDARPRA